MAIIRCNKCALIQEQPETLSRRSIPCPRCASATTVYPTVFFVEKLIEKYFDAQKELIRLQSTNNAEPVAAAPIQPAVHTSLADINLGNTSHLASELQHGPIFDWFQKKMHKPVVLSEIDSETTAPTNIVKSVIHQSCGPNWGLGSDNLFLHSHRRKCLTS